MERQVIESYASRLQLGPEVVQQAVEYHRMLHVKCSSTMTALALPASAKVIMCLELGAVKCRQSVDKVRAINLSGLPKKNYLLHFKSLQCLLNVRDTLRVCDLAVQLGCTEVVSSAQTLVCRYCDRFLSSDLDTLTTPVNAAAIYVAARLANAKLSKAKLVTLAGCRRAVLDRIIAHMEALSKEDECLAKNKDVDRPLATAIPEEADGSDLCLSPAAHKRHRPLLDAAKKKSDFLEWKEKILQQAAG